MTRFFCLEQEDVLFVVLIVARLLEQLEVVQVGSHDLIEATDTVLLSDQVHQLVVDHGAVRVEKGTAW